MTTDGVSAIGYVWKRELELDYQPQMYLTISNQQLSNLAETQFCSDYDIHRANF